MSTCIFRFHGNLNDFLSRRQQNRPVEYPLEKLLNLKDAIEAIGVPHVEIGPITINGTHAPLDLLPNAADEVDVYPITGPANAPARFVLDVHLGKLARLLRLLGFDTAYSTAATDHAIAAIAAREDRIALTRDIGLLKHKIIRWGYWLRSQDPLEQLEEITQRFALLPRIEPFAFCLRCNGKIRPAEAEVIWDLLPPSTQQHFKEFYQCDSCKKVYWKGSHYNRMTAWIENLKANG
jgi:uncharacterized protein with PIN domain